MKNLEIIKRTLLICSFSIFASVLNAQNYVINSYFTPMSTEMMISRARYQLNQFNEYRDLAYEALANGYKYLFIKYTDEALSTDYYIPQMYYDRGVVFQELGDYKQAKKNYKKAIKVGYYKAEKALAELKEQRKMNKKK